MAAHGLFTADQGRGGIDHAVGAQCQRLPPGIAQVVFGAGGGEDPGGKISDIINGQIVGCCYVVCLNQIIEQLIHGHRRLGRCPAP